MTRREPTLSNESVGAREPNKLNEPARMREPQ